MRQTALRGRPSHGVERAKTAPSCDAALRSVVSQTWINSRAAVGAFRHGSRHATSFFPPLGPALPSSARAPRGAERGISNSSGVAHQPRFAEVATNPSTTDRGAASTRARVGPPTSRVSRGRAALREGGRRGRLVMRVVPLCLGFGCARIHTVHDRWQRWEGGTHGGTRDRVKEREREREKTALRSERHRRGSDLCVAPCEPRVAGNGSPFAGARRDLCCAALGGILRQSTRRPRKNGAGAFPARLPRGDAHADPS